MQTLGFRLALYIFATLILSSCEHEESHTWTIAFQAIPTKLTTNESNINITTYLLKQTHLSILSEEESGQFDSKILQSWSRDPEFKNFIFCPNKNLKFDNSTNFSEKELIDSIKKTQSELEINFNIHQSQGCVHVSSKKSLPNLLKVLTDLRYAPTIECNPKWECGLGPFNVTSLELNKIELKRKTKVTTAKQFSKIVLALPSALKGIQISDINRTIEKTPDWINLTNYNKFDLNLLQTIVVLLNIKDQNIRKLLFNCFDSAQLTKAFNPEIKDQQMTSIATILPFDLYPTNVTTPNGCFSGKDSIKKPIYFVNWRANNEASLTEYLHQISRQTKAEIKLLNISPTEFVKELTERKNKFSYFNIIPMAISAENKDFSSFFRPIVAPNKKYLSFEIPKAAELYKKILKDTEKRESLETARKLADLIKSTYAAVPLYQVRRAFHYPKNIRNLSTGQNFLEYPEVEKLEVN